MLKNTEELIGEELDQVVGSIAGFVLSTNGVRDLLEREGHYATNNPESVPRGDPRYFMAPLADGKWVFGPSHMTVMKRAFVAAHRGMLVDVS